MKKTLSIILGILVIIIIFVMSFGIQIGNVRIGKQDDTLKIRQKYEIKKSEFSKTYLNNNKIICVNLWATWCIPCIKEMPLLNRIKKEYADKNIDFLSMSVDKDSIKLLKFIDTKQFDFEDITMENLEYRTAILNFLAQRPKDNKINRYSVPVTYLIKDNKIISEINGGLADGELEKELEKAL
jgi:thiol-disulfide isomerase/thioredoxin